MPRKARMDEGWGVLLLLIGLVLTSSLALVSTEWTDQLEVVPLAGLVGLVAGLLLSLSTFRGWFSHLLSAVYGVAWVGYLVGQTLSGELTWRERIFELATRIGDWVQQALSGGTSQDALIFLLFLTILLWILGHIAAWNTYRRRRPWLTAVALGLVPIVVTHFYIGEAPLIRYVVLYVLLALIYVGRTHAFKQEDVWRQDRVAFDPKLGFDILQSSLIMAVFVLALAWTLPSTSNAATSVSEVWERVNTPWERIEEEWQRLFSTIHSGETEIAEPFGSSLALGGPSSLNDTLVLDIQAPPDGRYYWRAGVYATYDGSQWDQPEGQVISLGPNAQAIAAANDASRRSVKQTVTNYLPGRELLVGASQLTSVDRATSVLARVQNERPMAFHRATSTQPLEAGEQYTVTSRMSQANAVELRQAGTGYPTWVSERYLQVPGSVPERVHTLARRIAEQDVPGGADSPYDKVKLLEQYLRETITYDLDPPAVPAERDYLDFLLFESRRTYCNGYATAMVIMARSLGIPARVATGYAEGTYDEERQIFRVRENNAHSWPEVYFPGYGWIEFEPTVSQDPLIRPDPHQEGAPEVLTPPAANEDLADDLRLDYERSYPIPDEGSGATLDQDRPAPSTPVQPSRLWPWLGGVLALVTIVAAGRWSMENLGFGRLPLTEKAYARLLRFGRWLGRPLQAPDTPLEWAQALSAIVPEAKEPIAKIVSSYLRAQFGQGDLRDPAADISWGEVRVLLWRHLLWGQWLVRLGLAPAAQ